MSHMFTYVNMCNYYQRKVKKQKTKKQPILTRPKNCNILNTSLHIRDILMK